MDVNEFGPFHCITVPPETIGITNGLPVHNDKLLVAILTVGVAFTVIVVIALLVLKQPAALVPDKLYVVVVLGLTTNGVEVSVCVEDVNVYELAPTGLAVGVMVVELPEHKTEFEITEIATVGVVLTTIVLVTVFALIHPATLVPLIV